MKSLCCDPLGIDLESNYHVQYILHGKMVLICNKSVVARAIFRRYIVHGMGSMTLLTGLKVILTWVTVY